MEKQEIFKTLSSYKKKLENEGYNVVYIGLYGSQNYNVDDELSDIDCKAIILPTLHDIIFRNPTSKVVDCENGSIDVKDLVTFYNVVKKGNFSYIEAMDTEYSIGDKYIKELFKQIRPNLKSIFGAMLEKRRALTHEYPSKVEEFKKWGFDSKQYHHILRLHDLLAHITHTGEQISYLKYNDEKRNFMIAEKRNKNNYIKEQVEKCSDIEIENAKKLIDENYKYEPIDLSEQVSKYLEKKLKIDLIKDSNIMSAREVRTFDNDIPKKDLEKFKELEKYKGKDISYIVYESLEIL